MRTLAGVLVLVPDTLLLALNISSVSMELECE